jgi:hypothetical protein
VFPEDINVDNGEVEGREGDVQSDHSDFLWVEIPPELGSWACSEPDRGREDPDAEEEFPLYEVEEELSASATINVKTYW